MAKNKNTMWKLLGAALVAVVVVAATVAVSLVPPQDLKQAAAQVVTPDDGVYTLVNDYVDPGNTGTGGDCINMGGNWFGDEGRCWLWNHSEYPVEIGSDYTLQCRGHRIWTTAATNPTNLPVITNLPSASNVTVTGCNVKSSDPGPSVGMLFDGVDGLTLGIITHGISVFAENFPEAGIKIVNSNNVNVDTTGVFNSAADGMYVGNTTNLKVGTTGRVNLLNNDNGLVLNSVATFDIGNNDFLNNTTNGLKI